MSGRSSAHARGIGQILHVRLRPPAGEGQRELARAGLAVAAGLSQRVLGGAGDGEGLQTTEASHIYWEGVEGRDLKELEPFASVVGSRLRELTLLSSRGHYRHVGIRLQFESAELVLLNLWDEIELYTGLVPDVLQPENEPGRQLMSSV